MTDQTQSTELTTLAPAQRAMIALDSKPTEARLRELVKETADIQDVKDAAGREQAHRAGMKLKNTRTAIEKTGKTAREDAQAFSKAVIAEEKRLIGMIADEEKRVLGLRDAYDAKVAAEKAEAERKERERVAAIRTKIDAIRQIPATMAGEPSDEIAAEIEALKGFVPDEGFAEFAIDARNAAVVALYALEGLYHRMRVQEEDAAHLAAERAEIERQRAEREAEEARLKAEREKLEDERRAFMMEQAQARREAEKVETGETLIMPVVQITQEQLQEQYGETSPAPDGAPDPERYPDLVNDDTTPVAQPWMHGNMVFDICYYAGLQLRTLAKKADAIGKGEFGTMLRAAAVELESGDLKEAVAQADLVELYQADIELVQHARDGQNAIQVHLFADGEAA